MNLNYIHLTQVIIILLCLTNFSQVSNAQEIKDPSEYLGYELGSQFTPLHRVHDYFEYVADQSPLVEFHEYGKTYEGRRLTYAIVSSKENLNKIEEIKNHEVDIPIVWLSYNVHGNEASSTESSLAMIYSLAMGKSPDSKIQTNNWLSNTMIIIDPCLNPDGRERYVNWFIQKKGLKVNSDVSDWQHQEGSINGRPNHYLFDLNRDWLWATQIESQQRLKLYQQWNPHIHVDFHEQGHNEPYYFAPAAKPMHPIITKYQKDFQTKIGENHAKYFDKEQWLYFTKEVFDLFYPSYGDTYPTFNGAIGMTYEQGGHSKGGLAVDTNNGQILTLKDRLIHHLYSGLSTIEITSKASQEVINGFNNFYNKQVVNPVKYYVLKTSERSSKRSSLKEFFDLHQINYNYLNGGSTISGFDYFKDKKSSYKTRDGDLVIPSNQKKAALVRVLFEKEAFLEDSLTYDITAWALPYSLGVETIATNSNLGDIGDIKDFEKGTFKNEQIKKKTSNSFTAIILKWNETKHAEGLFNLLNAGVQVRRAHKPFKLNNEDFDSGSLIVTIADNRGYEGSLLNEIKEAGFNLEDQFIAESGYVQSGYDLGSDHYELISNPRIAVLMDQGVSSLSFGSIWHFLDVKLKKQLAVIQSKQLSINTLSNFNTIILPSGYYSKMFNMEKDNDLKTWVNQGGHLIVIENAMESFVDKKGFKLKRYFNKDEKKEMEVEKKPAEVLNLKASANRRWISNNISGSIFKISVDASDPLMFGVKNYNQQYRDEHFILKTNNKRYAFLPSNNIGVIQTPSVISGFAGRKGLPKMENSLVIGQEYNGRGQITYFADNPLFRGFWSGSHLIFCNALID